MHSLGELHNEPHNKRVQLHDIGRGDPVVYFRPPERPGEEEVQAEVVDQPEREEAERGGQDYSGLLRQREDVYGLFT